MYGLSDRLKPLSAAEEQVLLALWDCPAPATRRDISEKLTATGWAPATVLNFLYRLEEKGWVKGGKAGSQNTYLPTVTRRAYCVAAMRQRMDTLFGGSPQIGLERKVIFARLHQPVADQKPVDALFMGIGGGRAVGAL